MSYLVLLTNIPAESVWHTSTVTLSTFMIGTPSTREKHQFLTVPQLWSTSHFTITNLIKSFVQSHLFTVFPACITIMMTMLQSWRAFGSWLRVQQANQIFLKYEGSKGRKGHQGDKSSDLLMTSLLKLRPLNSRCAQRLGFWQRNGMFL